SLVHEQGVPVAIVLGLEPETGRGRFRYAVSWLPLGKEGERRPPDEIVSEYLQEEGDLTAAVPAGIAGDAEAAYFLLLSRKGGGGGVRAARRLGPTRVVSPELEIDARDWIQLRLSPDRRRLLVTATRADAGSWQIVDLPPAPLPGAASAPAAVAGGAPGAAG